MRIFIEGWFHPKNKRGIELMNSEGLIFDTEFNQNINYDWIINLSEIKDYNLTYDCGFIYGPQIMFPSIDSNTIPKNKRCYCNVLSKWMVDLCEDIHKDINFINLPFAVDIDRFNSADKNENPIIYFKQRNPEILNDVINKLGNNFTIFNYEEGYGESDFLDKISRAPYAIWIGRHESQGFAFQETLSCNTPIFVIDVKSKREENVRNSFWYDYLPGHPLSATSASYFDSRCGLISYPDEWEEDFNIFIKNIIKYEPREFILETLSPKACIDNWIEKLK